MSRSRHEGRPALDSGTGALLERQFVAPQPSRETLLALAAFAAVTAFLYREALFGGQVIFRRDVSMVWLPQVEALVRSVSAGAWPLWDPFSGFGRPLLADPRAEVLYPPTWLNFVLPPRCYYTLFVTTHMLWSGWGLFALARRWRTSRAGATLAGALWCASGPFFSLTLMWHHMAGAAWIPWLFVALDRALDSGRPRDALLAGLTLAAQVVAGSPDLTALTLLALGGYVLLRRGSWRSRTAVLPTRAWRVGALALAFGLAVSAAQWLPTLEWSRRSARALQPYGWASAWSLHPLVLLEAVLPLRFDQLPLLPGLGAALHGGREPWLHSIYVGAAAGALALAGLLARGQARRGFLLSLLLAASLFSLGSHTPLHGALVRLAPPLGMLRFPVKAMVLAAFAWALLAGFGFDTWRATAATTARRARLAAASVFLALALGAAWVMTSGAEAIGPRCLSLGPYASYRDLLAPVTAFMALEAGACSILLLLGVRQRRTPFAPALVALAALAPLLARHADMGWTAPRELWTRRPALLQFLGDAPLTRLYVYDYSILTAPQMRSNENAVHSYDIARMPAGWTYAQALTLGVHMYLNPPTTARWGLFGSYDRDILDFDPEPLARLNEFLRASEGTPTHLRLLRMGGVDFAAGLARSEWWQGLAPVAEIEEVFERPIRLFRVPGALPRAYVTGGVRVADGPAAQALLDRDDFDPAREIVLPSGTPRPAPMVGPGAARIVTWRPDRVVVDAQLATRGHVVLLDAYDPGWRVRVDDQPSRLLRANVAFRAVALEPGRHTVEFRYRPASVVTGFAVSTLAFGAAAAVALRARRRARH